MRKQRSWYPFVYFVIFVVTPESSYLRQPGISGDSTTKDTKSTKEEQVPGKTRQDYPDYFSTGRPHTSTSTMWFMSSAVLPLV